MDYFEYLRAIRSSNLSYKARLVALIVASYYNWTEKKPAYPSNKTIADNTGLSIRSVIRAKQELVTEGYLVSHRQWDSATQYIPQCPVGNLYNNINNNRNNNNKVSNETLLSEVIEINTEKVSDFNRIFDLFEGDSNERTRRPRRQIAGDKRKLGQSHQRPGRNNPDIAEITEFLQGVAEAGAKEW